MKTVQNQNGFPFWLNNSASKLQANVNDRPDHVSLKRIHRSTLWSRLYMGLLTRLFFGDVTTHRFPRKRSTLSGRITDCGRISVCISIQCSVFAFSIILRFISSSWVENQGLNTKSVLRRPRREHQPNLLSLSWQNRDVLASTTSAAG